MRDLMREFSETSGDRLPQFLAEIPEVYLAHMKQLPIHPELAGLLAQVSEEVGEVRVLKVEPDQLLIVVLKSDPAPYLMMLKLEPQQIH
ncbi:Tfp pilus assembly protein PilO [Pseudomonas nitritireducens]|uniref:Tfp pilus assembly protein PilO n=1 Tax=Pseudomonas nitroreducens TaxID=46680 RepID=A0A7W7P3P3_PSENT|nr:hypothetical protein [Pseudomonas nitritireducens]MBB4865462.1 Tfp pilus assembly protein PilO [Pseudomonas nitritireducens]